MSRPVTALLASRCRAFAALVAGAALLAGCGGGGGKGPGVVTPPPTVSLSASPTEVGSGQSATLTWSSSGATACAASGDWTGGKATAGSESTGALTASKTYTLTCTNSAGSTQQSATVTVTPPPTVTLTASPSTVALAQSTTLTWVVTNATSCAASGAWTGAKSPTGGSELVSSLLANKSFTITCTGVSGTTAPQTAAVTVTAPPAGTVVITGKIEYERLPFNATLGQGLDANAPVVTPVRSGVVEVLASPSDALIATTTTDAAGGYAVGVNANINVKIRAKAQSTKTGSAPTWDFRVLNNTNGDALYVMDSAAFNTGAAQVNANHDLLAASGWGGSSYTGQRVAAPFAVLDTVTKAKELALTGSGSAVFPPLNIYWSTSNRPSSGGLCPDSGDIGTSFYVTAGANDDCGHALPAGIYVLGEYLGAGSDTDEFDPHVIAHEFGHYIEDKFSRSDSIGGSHALSDRVDLRVAFGEGWGNAYAAMALNDPVYRDSGAGLSTDFYFNLETNGTTPLGWYSEVSVSKLLWDFFDDATEPGDTVALGFAPIFAVMSGPQKTTNALTSIFSFATALRAARPAAATAITARLNADDVNGTDDFGAGETNNAGDAGLLPVYRDITLGTQIAVCSRNPFGSVTDPDTETANKLGNHVFLRFVNSTTRNLVVTLIGATNGANTQAAQDPDVYVWRQGLQLDVNGDDQATSTEVTTQASYPAATYILEVFDYQLTGTNTAPRCMTVSITGN